MRKRGPLHREAFDKVPELHALKMTPDEIADAIGVSGETARRWIDEHGLPRRTYGRYTVPTIRAVVQAVRDGMSMTKAAQHFAIPEPTLHRWCKDAGVTSNHLRFGAQPNQSHARPNDDAPTR